jgi:hypothetical protein
MRVPARIRRCFPALTVSTLLLAAGCAHDDTERDESERKEVDEEAAGPIDTKDFFYQSLCADAATDLPVAGDPASCPPGSRKRKMRKIDPITFAALRTDGKKRYSAYPTEDDAGNTRYAWVRDDIVGNGSLAMFDHDENGDIVEGFNIAEADGRFLASISSRDPQGYEEYYSTGCSKADGWVYFASTLGRNAVQAMEVKTKSMRNDRSCPAKYNTNWFDAKYIKGHRFTGGKVLNAIMSRQGPGAYAIRNQFEMAIFTEEYGPTAWGGYKTADNPKDMGVDPDRTGACGGLPPTVDDNGKRFFLQKCWEASRVEVLPPSEWRSAFSYPLPQYTEHGAGNLLQNPTFGNGSAGGTIAGWAVVGAPGVAVIPDARNNKHLIADCFGTCAQPIAIWSTSKRSPANRGKLHYGARVWARTPTPATLEVKLENENGGGGRVIASTPIVLGTQPALITGTTQAPSGRRHMTLVLHVPPGASAVHLDDAYIALTN